MHQWIQKDVTLPSFRRGCHLITGHILNSVPELKSIEVGLMHVFIRHTSASLSINENADPDVTSDLSMALDRLAPESWPWTHTCEGPDDMPAHVKSALTGSSVSIPISRGKLLTGTWQGIYLCEHRNQGGPRQLVITIQGNSSENRSVLNS